MGNTHGEVIRKTQRTGRDEETAGAFHPPLKVHFQFDLVLNTGVGVSNLSHDTMMLN